MLWDQIHNNLVSVQAFPRGRSKEQLKHFYIFYLKSKFGDFNTTWWAHVLYNLLGCKTKHASSIRSFDTFQLERLWTGRHPFKLAQPLKSTTAQLQAASTMKSSRLETIRWCFILLDFCIDILSGHGKWNHFSLTGPSQCKPDVEEKLKPLTLLGMFFFFEIQTIKKVVYSLSQPELVQKVQISEYDKSGRNMLPKLKTTWAANNFNVSSVGVERC